MTTLPRAFATDDRYDRDNASDGRSRYGFYLADHRHLFLDDVPTADVAWFAFSAWEVANSPIMSPGYVHTHPRVIATEPHWDDNGRPALTVRLVASWPLRVLDVLGPDVNTWRLHRDTQGCVYAWSEPWDNDTVSVFTTLTVRVPVVVDLLPTPRYRDDVPDTQTAKHAVNVLCANANTIVNALCVALDNPRGGQ